MRGDGEAVVASFFVDMVRFGVNRLGKDRQQRLGIEGRGRAATAVEGSKGEVVSGIDRTGKARPAGNARW